MSASATVPLHQLIYLSSASGDIGVGDLESILEASRRNNGSAGITGLLLFHDGCFFQALEGPEPEVMRTFDTIRRDRRHRGTIVLQSQPSSQRAFAAWSMGFVGSSQLSGEQRDTLIDLGTLLDGEARPELAASGAMKRQIDTFLDSFREFAAD